MTVQIMLIETALYRLLLPAETLPAELSARRLNARSVIEDMAGTRIFGGIVPPKDEEKDDVYPCLVYRTPPMGGRRVVRSLTEDCMLVSQPLLVFSTSKKNYGEAAQLDEAVFALLDEFRGVVTNVAKSPEEKISVQSVISTDVAHAYGYVESLKVHQFVTEFLFTYQHPLRGGQ